MLTLAALSGAAPLLAIGCGEEKGTLKPEECAKLRSDAFQIIKLGQPCNNDGECKESTFPECRRPLNQKGFDQIAELEKKHDDGKCKNDGGGACKDSPPVYCKQGLCAMKEPGTVRD